MMEHRAFNRCVDEACKTKKKKESRRNSRQWKSLKWFVIIPYDSVICWDRSWKMGATQLPFHYVASARMAEQHHSRFGDSTALLSTARTNDDGCCCERSSSQLGSNQLWSKDEAHSPMLPADKSKDKTRARS